MRPKWLAGIVLVLFSSLGPTGFGENRILFQDRFDLNAPRTPLARPPWTAENSATHPDHEAVVRKDDTDLFGAGVENHFLELRDATPREGQSRGSLQVSALGVLEHEVVTLSFRVYEPSGTGFNEQLTVQVFAGDGARASENRVQVFALNNGRIRDSEGKIAVYGEDLVRRLDLVINNSESEVEYADNQRLPSGLADIWIDGELAVAGFSFAREAGPGPIQSIDFSMFSNHNQRIFLDDITVLEGAVVGAPFEAEMPEVSFPLRLVEGKEVGQIFGYFPEYTQNVPSFDSRNRPYIRSRGVDSDATSFVHTIENGRWIQLDFMKAVRAAIPNVADPYRGGGNLTERVVFDAEDRAYMYLKVSLTTGGYRNLLLMSEDYCRTWQVVDTRVNGGEFAMEHDVGNNRLEGPPFLLLSRRQTAPHPDPWAAYHEFHVAQPLLENGELVFPGTEHVNDLLISIGQHSGGSSFSVTADGKTHFVWIEVTDEDVPGTPTYVATYDHETRQIGPKVLVAYAPPKNNSHNRPGVALDSEGYIHVVTGSHHGQNFYYTRSLVPHDVSGGWTEPEAVWESGWRAVNGEDRGGQTYVSLVCDESNTLHLVFRQWRNSDEYFPHGNYYAGLSYQRKPKDGEWTDPRLLVAPESDQYSIYYQKLAIDRVGRLFLSFSHFHWGMEDSNAVRFQKRMVILSDDGGDSWKLAGTDDFRNEIFAASYEEWQKRVFEADELENLALSGPEADPNGSGLTNLMRYALGVETEPLERKSLPEVAIREGQLFFEFPRRIHARDLDYRVEVSENLLEWLPGPDAEEISRTHEFSRMRIAESVEGKGRRFFRLQVKKTSGE